MSEQYVMQAGRIADYAIDPTLCDDCGEPMAKGEKAYWLYWRATVLIVCPEDAAWRRDHDGPIVREVE